MDKHRLLVSSLLAMLTAAGKRCLARQDKTYLAKAACLRTVPLCFCQPTWALLRPRADTAAAFNISVGDVQVTAITQVCISMPAIAVASKQLNPS